MWVFVVGFLVVICHKTLARLNKAEIYMKKDENKLFL